MREKEKYSSVFNQFFADKNVIFPNKPCLVGYSDDIDPSN